MDKKVLMYSMILLTGVFLSSVSQVMLKKSAMKEYSSKVREYLNPLVIGAYALFVLTTFMSILAYRGIPLSMGPLLEATSYIYISFWGVRLFHEKITKKKIFAIVIIILGIIIYTI